MMFTKIKLAVVGATSSLALLAAVAPAAHAGLLSLTPGACGQQESQPFAPFGDNNTYVLFPGGTFEPGSASWALHNGARVVAGNESYDASGRGSYSLSLPAGSSATSPGACTGLDHPSARMFVRNTGSPSSRLNVTATLTGVLGLIPVKVSWDVTGSSSWQPSSPLDMGLLTQLLGNLNLTETHVSLTVKPADSTGNWHIDDVYLDPYHRY